MKPVGLMVPIDELTPIRTTGAATAKTLNIVAHFLKNRRESMPHVGNQRTIEHEINASTVPHATGR
jgi:hypothetical protein